MRLPPGLAERFLEKIQLPDVPFGCWIWRGGYRNDYGSISINGTIYYAHQCAWMLYRGKLIRGKKLLHSCDNNRCVNPAHLEQSTQRRNVKDGIKRGRIKVFEQTRNRVDQALLIQDRSNGLSQRALAKKHDMGLTTVRRLLGLVK